MNILYYYNSTKKLKKNGRRILKFYLNPFFLRGDNDTITINL